MEDMVGRDFWAGRRVLVTGHTGFKGAWLCLWLQRLGAQVSGFSLPGGHWRDAPAELPLPELAEDLRGDLRDSGAVAAAVSATRPEVVFHLAAQSLVRPSYADPLGTLAVNVMGTAHVLEAVRRAGGVRAVLVVTSDKCYENREWVWPYRESDPLGGRDPYSGSKACAEIVAGIYGRSFFPEEDWAGHGVALATARAGNVIGGGDWSADRLLPDLVRAALAGRPAALRAPQSVRPWQHVLDPLAGYLLLARRLVEDGPRFAAAWNFGPEDGHARTVGWLADQFVRQWDSAPGWRCEGGDGLHEAGLLRLDSSRARMVLGWRPRLSPEEGVAWAADWYRRACGEPGRAGEIALRQIEAYGRDASL